MNVVPRASQWGELIRPDRVHGSLYSDPAIFAAELQNIWYRTWVYVGHESEVPDANDYVVKSIGPQSVIMTRDEQGKVNLLLNRCSHRGNQVCSYDKGNARSFTCPFHSWTFANDGRLVGYAFPDGYEGQDKSKLALGRVTRVQSYRGFVFGSFAAEGPTLEEHLGGAAETIDRLVRFSPEGEVEVTAGFLKHRVKANWKFILENECDGYHPAFVHSSIFGVADSAIGKLYGGASTAVTRDYGNGHTEIDLRPEFRKRDAPMSWFGTTEERLPDYTARMKAAYGDQQAREIMIDGTPHVMIFPNLFIAEIQMFVIQPLAVDDSVQHVTALQFKGAPDMNRRLRQQTMGSVGPAGLLLADDFEMYERCHRGVLARNPEWIFLGRGEKRERQDELGFKVGHVTDEIPSRGIWRHYRSLMETVLMLSRESSATLMSAVTAFIYKEARLQDEHQYEAWEALWTDDGVYWVPANGDDIDPEKEMSIIYDNRSRISLRIKQLLTGKRHTQTPQSRLRRLVSNIELLDEQPGGDIPVASNSMVFESSLRDDTIWAARNEYRLRYVDGELRMAYKKVILVNNEKALFTLSFLI